MKSKQGKTFIGRTKDSGQLGKIKTQMCAVSNKVCGLYRKETEDMVRGGGGIILCRLSFGFNYLYL